MDLTELLREKASLEKEGSRIFSEIQQLDTRINTMTILKTNEYQEKEFNEALANVGLLVTGPNVRFCTLQLVMDHPLITEGGYSSKTVFLPFSITTTCSIIKDVSFGFKYNITVRTLSRNLMEIFFKSFTQVGRPPLGDKNKFEVDWALSLKIVYNG